MLCIVGAFLGRMQTNSRNEGRFDLVGAIVTRTVGFPASIMASTANVTSDFFGGVFQARSLARRNELLLKQLNALSVYSDQISQLQRDVDNLRAINALPPVYGRTKVVAQVIGHLPAQNRILVSVSSSQGVRAGMPVVTGEGLVGVVQAVGAGQATVALLSSPPPFTVGGLVASRNPPPVGLLRGDGGPTLTLQFDDPSAPVKNNDLVVTSGFSENIPRGIVIGRVIQVVQDLEFGRLQAKVYPSVSMGNVREVIILK